MIDTSLLALWPLIVAGGFGVGFLVGMTGVGAGSLMTPFLITQVGVQPALAVGTDLLFASITKASAAAPHHTFGNVNWRIVRWLAAGSVPGAIAMLLLIKWLEPDLETMGHVIRSALIGALALSAATIIAYPIMMRGRLRAGEDRSSDQHAIRPVPTLLLGLLLGSVVTLTSVGAGAIGVVILTLLYPALLTRRLIGTDIVHAVPLTLVSGLGHLGMGNADFLLLGLLLAGSLPGIALGSRLTGRLPDWLLRTILAAILIFAASQLYARG
ncbi:sulfite exporter TauE/SafE family protein [Hyphomicrobium sp.]|uniref:sulfite exporter TauE/SafE family protein n=1 Tax=Hyphomicrobium sp. TaxID=82 RepID=UPI002FDCD3CD